MMQKSVRKILMEFDQKIKKKVFFQKAIVINTALTKKVTLNNILKYISIYFFSISFNVLRNQVDCLIIIVTSFLKQLCHYVIPTNSKCTMVLMCIPCYIHFSITLIK